DGGTEIDRALIKVENTTRLDVDRQFSEQAPARILAGSLQGLHVTTMGDSGILVGTGAVEFHLEGDLLPFPMRGVAPPWWGGDANTCTGARGRGRVVAGSGWAQAEVPVEVVDPSSLGTVTLTAAPARWPAPVDVAVAADANGAPVYGAQCRWSWPFSPPEWL